MAHHHHHHHHVNGRKLAYSIILNIAISVAQLIGGIVSGSMALITDSIHNFSDVLSLIISYIANKLSQRTPTVDFTFGYKRSEIIAAFVNSASLIVIAIIIVVEAIERFADQQVIQADLVIWLAIASILVNGLSVLFIQKDAKKNMNMKSAYLHLFSDMLTSIAVLIGGLSMKFFHWYQIDTIFSLAIAIYLLYMSWDIFKNSLKILMQFTPERIDITIISKEIETIAGIKNIHHVHVWQINEHDIIFEAHIDMKTDIKISEFEKILDQIEEILNNHHVFHFNIQPEFTKKDNKQMIAHAKKPKLSNV